MRTTGRLVTLLAAAALSLAAGVRPVQAAYPPGPYPGPAPGGSFPTVVVSETLTTDGGTIVASQGTSNLRLEVPAGAFDVPTQITIYGGSPSLLAPLLPGGTSFVVGFAVAFNPTSTPRVPLRLTITDPTIGAGAGVYKLTENGLSLFGDVTVDSGSVVVAIGADPAFVVANRPAVTLVDLIAPGVNRGTSGFGTRSLVVPRGSYVTVLVRTDPSLAGALVGIWVEHTQNAWRLLTLRRVGADGTVHYYARVYGWTGYWVRFAGDISHAPAASHGRIAVGR
jgi:hypothetical protein